MAAISFRFTVNCPLTTPNRTDWAIMKELSKNTDITLFVKGLTLVKIRGSLTVGGVTMSGTSESDRNRRCAAI